MDVPLSVTKAREPTVCFVSRWEPRKRPEVFFELARDFPHVRFIAVGGTDNRAQDDGLRKIASRIPNLEIPGLIDQFETDALARIYERSWILVNTSPREGLPNTFPEAAASRCAILSLVDPEGFASRFGYHAAGGDLHKGLRFLLEVGWKQRGESGYEYVKATYATEKAIDLHIGAYREALERKD
jgi:glycosyltransferase involved in cell wall biosynthesis